jgi:hypothetical protein
MPPEDAVDFSESVSVVDLIPWQDNPNFSPVQVFPTRIWPISHHDQHVYVAVHSVHGCKNKTDKGRLLKQLA